MNSRGDWDQLSVTTMDLMDMLLSSKPRAVATVTLLFFLSVF